MKSNYEILSEAIEVARQLGNLDYKLQQKEYKSCKCIKEDLPEIEKFKIDYQEKIADLKNNHELELELNTKAERLNTLKWLYEDNRDAIK